MKTSSIKYKKLPKLIRPQGQGFDYHLIERKGDIAWYEARYPNGIELKGFVVAKIRIKNATILPSGKFMPKQEKFPSRSEFGKCGWFFLKESRDKAQNHYQKLLNQVRNKEIESLENDTTKIGASE